MKTNYRDCEISVYREGDEFLVFSIMKDGFEITSGFSESKESVRDFMNGLKSTVDDFIKNPSEWE
jgi:hypothetical protein